MTLGYTAPHPLNTAPVARPADGSGGADGAVNGGNDGGTADGTEGGATDGTAGADSSGSDGGGGDMGSSGGEGTVVRTVSTGGAALWLLVLLVFRCYPGMRFRLGC